MHGVQVHETVLLSFNFVLVRAFFDTIWGHESVYLEAAFSKELYKINGNS